MNEMKRYRIPRLAFFLPTPGDLTGAPRRVLTLMVALRDRGRFDVALVADPSDRLAQEAARAGIRVLSVPIGPILAMKHGALLSGTIGFRGRVAWELVQYNHRMVRALRAYRPDAIWIRGGKGIALGGLAAFVLRCPMVWDIDYELPSRGVVARLHDLGLWLSDKVVLQYAAASERIFGLNRARKFQEKFDALIPGIDLERLRPYREARTRQGANTAPSGVFRILQVGTICDRKNQRFTLRVMYELRRYYPDLKCELWIAGDEYEADYAAAVRRDLIQLGLSETVKMLGWRDDIAELMARADLFVFPSKDEGVPNAVQEAMYIGCPVLASDAGGIPAIVENGRTGWVLPIDSPSAWAHKIAYLITRPEIRLQVAQEATYYAERTFDVKQWATRYEEIFARLIEGSGQINRAT